jgi:hypothetical protein
VDWATSHFIVPMNMINDELWYKDGVFYQVSVRAFKGQQRGRLWRSADCGEAGIYPWWDGAFG